MKIDRFFYSAVVFVFCAFLAGCAGVPTTGELSARKDIQKTKSAFRPEGAKPELPNLTENSNLAEIIQFALLNNPKVESAFYEWKFAVEMITVERSLPDPQLSLGVEIRHSLEALAPMLMVDLPGPGKLTLQAEAAYSEAQKRRALFENELLTTAFNVKRVYYQINQDVYTDHKGKRIYFCCLGCIDEFKKDPERFLKKMRDEGIEPESIGEEIK